jgi:hypothetical protein
MFGSKSMNSKTSLLALLFSISLLGCQPEGPETLPTELEGVWMSPAPRYKNDTLELSKEFIVFTSGNSQDFVNVNFIVKVEEKPGKDHIFYIIHYENIDEQRYKFAFYYYPSSGGVMRLKNRKDIEWRKVKPIEH